MTINIELPDETVATLIGQAQEQGRPAAQLAAEAVMERFGTNTSPDEFPLDADTIESIRRGFADVNAGRTVSLEEARAEFETAFAARYGEGHT